MKLVRISVYVAIFYTLFGCGKDPVIEAIVPEKNSLDSVIDGALGVYQINIKRSNFYFDNEIYYSSEALTIGKIERFAGYVGNYDDLDQKIGILFDTANTKLITGHSNYRDLEFRYLNYIHPSVSEQNWILTYPELIQNKWNYDASFSGRILKDSFYFSYSFTDPTFHSAVEGYGKKIK